MLAKLGIYVCPVPGCATIGRSATAGCSKHSDRALKREVYVHEKEESSFADLLGGLFGEKR